MYDIGKEEDIGDTVNSFVTVHRLGWEKDLLNRTLRQTVRYSEIGWVDVTERCCDHCYVCSVVRGPVQRRRVWCTVPGP